LGHAREQRQDMFVCYQRMTFKMNAKTVAIIEDEAIIALELESICMKAGLQVVGLASTASNAWEKFSDIRPDVLISDMELADGSEGVEVVVRLRKLRPDMVVIFVTATAQQDKLDRIEASNPDRVLNKPIDVAKLRTALAETAS